MLNGALFAIIEEAASSVLILMEGIEEDEFRKSRLTRSEVRRQLLTIAGIAAQLTPEARQQMPEMDWDGWLALGRQIGRAQVPRDAEAEDETLWFGIRSLAPATLMWLRVYRQSQPELFRFVT